MKITCPACGFSRDVAPDRLPGSSVIATCPKCGNKFKISASPKVEDEEDIRQIASRAYQQEADRFQDSKKTHKEAEIQNNNPWDLAPEPAGWITAFLQTLSRVMFSASRFFSGLPRHVSLMRPLGFYAILLLFQSIVDRLWANFFLSVLAPSAASDPQLEKMLQLLASEDNLVLGILFRCGLLVLQIYLFALILYLIYRILAPGKASYELVFQILAYSSAPVILCVVPVLGSLVGMIWSVGCLLLGCKVALDLDWTRTLIGFLPIIFLMAPLLSALLGLVG